MRKIKSQTQLNKEKRRGQIIVGVVLVVLMMLSTIGYSSMDRDNSTEKKVDYYGITFVNSNGLWEIEGTQIYFNYLPTELTDVSIEGNYNLFDYTNETVYFVNYTSAGELIINNLRGQIERYQEACLDENCGRDLPVKNCSVDNLIVFTNEERNRVYKQDKCVFITQDYTKGIDAFIYKLFELN